MDIEHKLPNQLLKAIENKEIEIQRLLGEVKDSFEQ